MSFSSIDNKKLIWSLLVETAYFKGFPANQKDMVKRVLDSVVHEMSQTPTYNGFSVMDKNKEVVKQMMAYRDLWAQDGTISNTNSNMSDRSYQTQGQTQQLHNNNGYNQLPSYTSQVTAEEIRERREQEFNDTLRRKQAEMEGFLNANKPSQIDFSDKAKDERIGGDMERLVAEEEARRKREMDNLLNQSAQMSQKDVEKWINGGKPLKIDNESTLPIEAHQISPPKTNMKQKTVRFDDGNNQQQNNRMNVNVNDDDFFNKLKRKQMSNTNIHTHTVQGQSQVSFDNDKIIKRIDNLELSINQIQTDIKQILEFVMKNSLQTQTS